MVASGHVDKGAIYSIAGDSKWAGSAGFEVRPSITCHLYLLDPRVILKKKRQIHTGRMRGHEEDELTLISCQPQRSKK
jgi:hypothetical protein